MVNPRRICSSWFLLILLFPQDQGRATPVANMQSLSKLLEEEIERPGGSEEVEQEQGEEALLTGAMEQQGAPLPWPRNPREEASIVESAFQRLFSDLLGPSRSFRGRSKKGLSRGCFGVKLDRIGAMSGLGC